MSEVGLNYGLLAFDPLALSMLPFFVSVRSMSTKPTRKTTIQKNMVTLKSLKEELEAIKSKHAAVASHTITNDKKGNQVNFLILKLEHQEQVALLMVVWQSPPPNFLLFYLFV